MKRILLTMLVVASFCLSSGIPKEKKISSSKVDVLTQCWVACELSFEASENDNPSSLIMDAIFTNRNTGTKLTVPSFWDGGKTFKVRFAPTETGIWDYVTICAADKNLDGLTGKVGSNPYDGNCDIYKHGFVTVQPGKKYLVYADGTPFFYLGDTHWNYLEEEIDEPGEFAGSLVTDSHFRYIVDKRVEQGFTVYQSEPIGSKFDVTDGKISEEDVKGFQKTDEYYQYLASKGLVHANAEFFFDSAFTPELARDQIALEMLSRYWVARYGAYPVMWTLAQEADNDFYFERGRKHNFYDYTSNPWIKIAEYLHKYDCYSHPLSAHQENTGSTTVTGAGTSGKSSGAGISAFQYEETIKGNKATGHNWWAAQWAPSITTQNSDVTPKDYWNSWKPAILYEGRYCYLWTKDFGARVQGWAAFLSGMYGYGYGAIEMWLYKSTYDLNSDSNDGVDTITKMDKRTPWSSSIEFPSGYQVGYMKQFLQKIQWWKLIPDFNEKKHFVPESGAMYLCATDGNETYVVYLYNRSVDSGSLSGLDSSAIYVGQWFNPRANQYGDSFEFSGSDSYKISKPDTEDWVFLATKK